MKSVPIGGIDVITRIIVKITMNHVPKYYFWVEKTNTLNKPELKLYIS